MLISGNSQVRMIRLFHGLMMVANLICLVKQNLLFKLKSSSRRVNQHIGKIHYYHIICSLVQLKLLNLVNIIMYQDVFQSQRLVGDTDLLLIYDILIVFSRHRKLSLNPCNNYGIVLLMQNKQLVLTYLTLTIILGSTMILQNIFASKLMVYFTSALRSHLVGTAHHSVSQSSLDRYYPHYANSSNYNNYSLQQGLWM